MAKYKLVNDRLTGALLNIKEKDSNPPLFIPIDTGNIDYQEYLEWAKTNTPEAAD